MSVTALALAFALLLLIGIYMLVGGRDSLRGMFKFQDFGSYLERRYLSK